MAQKIVLIGASTGGPGHIKKLLSNINLGSSIIIIAQHMSKTFMPSFATQLGKESGLNVELLEDKTNLQGGSVYICSKNFVISENILLSAKPCDEKKTTYSPNVDLLFNSGVNISKSSKVLAILLTGIGDDGAIGLKKLYETGARCIAESEESAIVYGMPKRAKELNPNVRVLNLAYIKKELEDFLNAYE